MDRSKIKAFRDKRINATEKLKFVFGEIRKHGGEMNNDYF